MPLGLSELAWVVVVVGRGSGVKVGIIVWLRVL